MPPTTPAKPNAGPTCASRIGQPEALTRHWLGCAWAVFRKDVQIELRTRYAVGAVLLFAVTTLVAVSGGARAAAPVKSDVKAALLWIVLLFAALSGLARAFVREEEAGTAAAAAAAGPGDGGLCGQMAVQCRADAGRGSRRRAAVSGRPAARRP